MKILAVDSSTMMSSIALLEDDDIIASYNINQKRSHGENLIPMIKNLLDFSGLDIKDIDLFATGIGPGSFTGLRIGITTIKTLAQVLDKEIIGVSTLKALAYNIDNNSYIIPIIDARGTRVFYGVYKWENNKIITVEEDSMEYLDELIERVSKKYDNITFIGEAINMYKKYFDNYKKIKLSDERFNNLISSNIAIIAKKEYKEIVKIEDVKPNYVRLSQAQRDYDERNKI